MTDVTVIQADRDAAASYVREGKGRFAEYTASLIERGEHDSDLVIAFARHRLADLSDAQGEPVAWMYTKPGATHVTPTRWKDIVDGKWVDGSPYWFETPLYTRPPAQDVAALVEALRRIERMSNTANDFVDLAKLIARTALAKHESTPHD